MWRKMWIQQILKNIFKYYVALLLLLIPIYHVLPYCLKYLVNSSYITALNCDKTIDIEKFNIHFVCIKIAGSKHILLFNDGNLVHRTIKYSEE